MAEEGNPQAWQRRARDVPIIMRVARVSSDTRDRYHRISLALIRAAIPLGPAD